MNMKKHSFGDMPEPDPSLDYIENDVDIFGSNEVVNNFYKVCQEIKNINPEFVDLDDEDIDYWESERSEDDMDEYEIKKRDRWLQQNITNAQYIGDYDIEDNIINSLDFNEN